MTAAPTFDDIFAAIAAASVGDAKARVSVSVDAPPDDTGTRLAVAVNVLLDDLAFRAAEVEAAHQSTQLELERQVAARTAELASVNQELEAFSYSVAHDLRAPLRSIDGFSQALLEDCAAALDETGKTYLGHVRQSAQHMARLIHDLLTLAQVTRSELIRRPIDVTALAHSVVARLQKQQPERTQEIVIAEGLVANGDVRLLGVVLDNLLGNAWKFTAKCPAPRIELGTRNHEGGRAFFVRDNGAGFDMAYAGKLFGVFQRLHSAAEFDGTGIGLATVQRIVRRHGGRVWAEGEVGRGATFYFTLAEEKP